MKAVPYEIERKYLIRRPDEQWLRSRAEASLIEQTYLLENEVEGRARVRARTTGDKTVYTHTVKRRVNDLRAVEIERVIEKEEYDRLLKNADPDRRTILKTRFCLPYEGQMFEIDLYPFWQTKAIMEIELEDETQPVTLPPEIVVLREVSSDRRYSNAALALLLAMEHEGEPDPERMILA